MSSDGDEAAAASKRPLRFMDLPLETQNDIIDHCSQSELVCLAVVSRHFHELVSAKLYRNFHIVFPDDDDIDFGSPIDGLAGGLDTFTTSEYNYAKHLRDLSMDTLSPGRKGELSYQPYLYSATCGKFFNTLLYLTLKKAKFLEGFAWNIRVELTRQVYGELHKISSLKKLHVRMQTGDSYYIPPPPLPITLSPIPPLIPSNNHWQSAAHSSLSYGHAMLEPPSIFSSSKPFSRNKGPKKQPAFGPPTFSGFKNLKTLAVLDIDSLSCVSELQACVKQSYSTLTELQLSLSDTLAGQARRPPVDSDTESSDSEELYEVGNSYETNRPAKVFRAQEEKKRQELMLSRIFDVEPGLVKKPQIQRPAAEVPAPEASADDASNQDTTRAEEFVASWKEISSRLMAGTNGSKEFSTDQQNILDIIEQAARKYVSYEKTKVDEPAAEGNSANSTADPSPAALPVELPIRLATRENSDAIDQATPSQNLDELAGNHEILSRSSSHRASKKESTNSMATKGKAVEPSAGADIAPISDTESESSEKGARKKSVDEYIKTTRGISLETLALHLVPVRASVLSRALDLTTLKSLTLLNVGNQAPIWSMLMNENKLRPLALRSLFTDNASLSFLTCVSQLEEIHDLFMLERNIDHKPESFAPRAATTIDQIRRLVLKKHARTLKRLMIKDDTKEASWDANEKTMILLCTRGKALEELAVSMNIHAVHAFMQYFSGMFSLRAINILHFKNSDTCLWVMREVLRFIVDNLSHYPELKLEWIAMEDDRVDRVVRPNDLLDDQPSEDANAKQKTPNPRGPSSLPTGMFPQAPLDQIDYGSESEDETFDSGGRLRLQTEGPLQFYDVWGVKIFDKEIRSGQL